MIEFDPEKEAASPHGIPFDLARELFAGYFVETVDDRFDYGEVRLSATGSIESLADQLCTAIYTWRGARRRIISLRRANDREKRRYSRGDAGKL